ncbi:MAG: spermidine synthase [Bradymonadia bacterium]|jgi:spermidine synthase
MLPWALLGEASTPDGGHMTLTRRGREFMIMVDGKDLMSSQMSGSEEALVTIGCEQVGKLEAPQVLIGGLGMGFTLRSAVATLPPGARIVVSELMPCVVEWNRGPLGHLAGHPLEDRRVHVEVGDVAHLLRASPGRFDAILMDVDNGPTAFTQKANEGLYGNDGLMTARAALRPGGTYAVWSAWDDRKFEHRLRYHGFEVETHRVRGRLQKGGPRHTIFVGRLGRSSKDD